MKANIFKRGDLCIIIDKYSACKIHCYCIASCKGHRIAGNVLFEVMSVESNIVCTQAIDNTSNCAYRFYYTDLQKI
jgi:hypothetical protein